MVFRLIQRIFAVARVSMAVGPEAKDVRRVVSLLQPVKSPCPLIRIGGDRDGGYLVPDDFDGVGACFSPGVAESAHFELALANRGIESFMIDYSVDDAPIKHDLFDFEKLFLGIKTDGEKYIRLDDWIAEKLESEEDLVLQMDIEGAEWAVLADVTPEVLRKFRVISVEIHDLDAVLTNPYGLQFAEAIFTKIRSDFAPVHIHPNNSAGELNYMGVQIPRVLEITFLRNDRFQNSLELQRVQVPHPLDVPNVPSRKDIKLKPEWTGFP
jgi:hypothetical protein